MSRLNVNPTRMELKKLKARLKTATRGHKLLKDKSDEMIRRFSALIKLNKTMRDEIEQSLSEVLKEFSYAKGQLSKGALENAFMMPTWAGMQTLGMTAIGIFAFGDQLRVRQKWSIVCGLACIILMNLRICPLF